MNEKNRKRIKTVFGPLYKDKLSKRECIEIEKNLADFFNCLIDIEKSAQNN